MSAPAAVERDRKLFSRVAESDPGLIRTLLVLVDELERSTLDTATRRGLGDHLRRIGNKLIEQAERIVIDQR